MKKIFAHIKVIAKDNDSDDGSSIGYKVKTTPAIKNLYHDAVFGYRHRPWWKVALNNTLRFMQFWDDKPWVVSTEMHQDSSGAITGVSGYKMVKVDRIKRGQIIEKV